MKPKINEYKTKVFSELISQKLDEGLSRDSSKILAGYLGCQVTDKSVQFCIWYPGLNKQVSVFIEIYNAITELIYDKPDQHCNMTYHRLPATKTGDFIIAVVDQIKVGNESDFGAFYQFVTTDKEGNKRVIRDPMAWSLPYGIYAPAEVYDINSVLKNRKDHAYYRSLEQIFRKNGDNRIPPSTNLLEIHTGLSTNEGTIHELAMRFQQTGINIQKDLPLTTFQTYLAGFDGVELMPIEPVIQNTEHHKFWTQVHEPGESTDELTIHLRRPSVTNWGYDTPLYGAASVNPSLLSTGRPHELLQLIETLHNFPAGPVKLLLDVVFGHADKQAQLLLPDIFFAGNNMYGLNINFKHPLVRAIILEIVKRKLGWGIDGLRIDASHDITYYDAETDTVHIDDEFLREMSSVEAEAAGVNFRPWMIFEDARPWPRSDWELACTYRDVTFQQKHPHQWGPMIFAYNTPYTLTYWLSKWWRIREQCRHGNKWITGYANHDTFRRGTQSDPSKSNVNHLLGNSLKAVMEKAYNNPSATLLMNGFLPGVPMDFLHPLSGTPWSFIRNTDTDFSVKITAQEAHFTEWQITSVEFQHTRFFKKLKNLGFVTIDGFRRFAKTLQFLINVTGNNLKLTAELLNQFEPPFEVHDWDIKKLNHFSSCWMQDMCEYCNTDMHTETADTRKAIFNFHVRQFRLRNPWLNNNFGHDDFLHYKDPAEGSVIYYGYRKNEVTGKEIIFLANMEGQANQVTPTQFEFPIKHPKKWRVAVSTPSVRAKKIDQPLRLSISQGIIFETGEHD